MDNSNNKCQYLNALLVSTNETNEKSGNHISDLFNKLQEDITHFQYKRPCGLERKIHTNSQSRFYNFMRNFIYRLQRPGALFQ